MSKYEPIDTWEKEKQYYKTREEFIALYLEKIKAEIDEKSFNYPLTDNFENDIVICVINVSDMYKIIDKHISELKGESNVL